MKGYGKQSMTLRRRSPRLLLRLRNPSQQRPDNVLRMRAISPSIRHQHTQIVRANVSSVNDIIPKLLDLSHLLMLTFVASAARYANGVIGGNAFRLSQFFLFMTVSFFAAFLAGEFIPLGTTGRDGLIGLAAYSGIYAIRFFETKFFRSTQRVGAPIEGQENDPKPIDIPVR